MYLYQYLRYLKEVSYTALHYREYLFAIIAVSQKGTVSINAGTRLGDKFCVAEPRVWNSIRSSTLRQPDIEFGQFKRPLKTFLFVRDRGAI